MTPDDAAGRDRARLHAAHVEEWGRRFAAACGACEVDGCVVFAGEVSYRFRDDLEIPWVAEPWFRAWAPEAWPGSAIKFVPGDRPQLIYRRTEDFWHLPPPEPAGDWVRSFDIREVGKPADLRKALGAVAGLAAIGEAAHPEMGFASVNDPGLLAHLDYHRAFKTPYEVACIEAANRIAAAGHGAVRRALGEGVSEFDLNQVYCGATGQRESALPYPNIVALNEHAAVLHYQHLDRRPPARFRSFLLDAGALCNGYVSDVSRTYAGNGAPFAALIASMDAMQQRLCAAARDGTDFVALHESAHRLLAEILADHGIVRCSVEEACERGIVRTFFPHGLGHLLGLQVHDAGGRLHEPGAQAGAPPAEHPFLRLTRTLRPGFVITVEPGIYFIPALLGKLGSGRLARLIDWPLVDRLRPFGGIRIEDNVLVTAQGSRNLTRPAFRASGSAQDRPARDLTARQPPAQDRLAQDLTARQPSTHDSPAQDRPARDLTARQPPAQDRLAQDLTARQPSTHDSPARDRPAQDLTARQPSTHDSPARDRSSLDGPAHDPSARRTG